VWSMHLTWGAEGIAIKTARTAEAVRLGVRSAGARGKHRKTRISFPGGYRKGKKPSLETRKVPGNGANGSKETLSEKGKAGWGKMTRCKKCQVKWRSTKDGPGMTS